ncbi:MAG TPA: AmmeMemoRadiSam system protein B [Beijerinckiaceae bacterium]|nr:AmmeMemoRadiSam system protein B [Beijerinckiaceae bacterium]
MTRSDRPHAPEHAIEVELPFLQHVLPAFDLVPLVAGNAGVDEVGEVLGRLWGGAETLVVVSSDLSHFHPFETARRLDAATAAAIENGTLGAGWARTMPAGSFPLPDSCSRLPRMGSRHGGSGLCNSGDTAGPRDRVVDYGAWTFTPAADA